MKKLSQLLVMIGLTIVMGILFVMPVFADASITSYDITCSGISVTGASDSPYVMVETSVDGISVDFQAIAVTGGSYSHNVAFSEAPVGTYVEIYVWGATDNTGLWDNGTTDEVGENCVAAPTAPVAAPVFTGPGIPEGFVMVYITCTTAVYDAPAGSPVGEAAVTEGQTWFVNPVSVEGDDGKAWTEIFVSSTINPYIPTNCVGL